MFKLITYPMVMLTALIMGNTNSSPVDGTYDFAKPLPYKVLLNSPASKLNNTSKRVNADCYKLWQLDCVGLSEDAFNYAMNRYGYLSKENFITKKNIVTIVDFSKPSNHKSLYVVDISSGKVLFNTWVAHGRNSGNEYANQFSNSPESHQSSLGFYTTLDTYTGGNGYSLRLKGCEKGINDKAFERAIVIHGAEYVIDRFINSRGIPGRSYGCPAIPAE